MAPLSNKIMRKALYLGVCLTVGVRYLLFTGAGSSRPQLPISEYSSAEIGQEALQLTTPACSIWPDWRQSVPAAAPADDTALPPSRIGTAEVFAEQPAQGCIPAHERLGPFGHSSGRSHDEERPWSSLRWGKLQSDCATAHFGAEHADWNVASRKLERAFPGLDDELKDPRLDNRSTGRTAVVLRTWDSYQYYENQMAWMRAMTTELSLDTGGRFQLFILVDVKDQSLDLFDDQTYAEVLEQSVPEEFRDVALLFSERLLAEWFPKTDEHGSQDQMYQALQIFSHTFPEYDFVWQLEMDVRFTGNVASILTNTERWAERQPRKNLWERNARWYIPDLWNNYAEFSAKVDDEFQEGQGIWGPDRYAGFYVKPQGPIPPERSNDTWGIGEPADLINFAPLIDPVGTGWVYEHTVHGFEPASNLPRRMAIVSMTRTSRRLLRLISQEQRASGSWVVSESTPETWSFLHGLKAVYAPHLFAFNLGDDKMTPDELNEMLHKGPPWSLAGGEHAGFLWCSNDINLPELRWLQASYFYWAGDAPRAWWDYTNGTCTYPLLLHPVKDD